MYKIYERNCSVTHRINTNRFIDLVSANRITSHMKWRTSVQSLLQPCNEK